MGTPDYRTEVWRPHRLIGRPASRAVELTAAAETAEGNRQREDSRKAYYPKAVVAPHREAEERPKCRLAGVDSRARADSRFDWKRMAP